MKILRLLELARDATELSLRDRAAALRATAARTFRRESLDQAGAERRVLIAGSLAAAVPLPVLAMIVGPTSSISPDTDLLAAGDRYFRAIEQDDGAREAYGEAWGRVYPVLQSCPSSLLITRDEKYAVLGGWRWPSLLGKNPRHIGIRREDAGTPRADDLVGEAWTVPLLREAIRQAVSLLGQGGQTPHRIRRWRQLLPVAEGFDAEMDAIKATTGLEALSQARRTAEKELSEARLALHGMVATTPEGLAVLTRLIGSYPWKDFGCGMPNLLLSAANVSGVDLADLEHPYASTRKAAEPHS